MKLSDKEWRVLEALWSAPEGLTLGAAVEALRPVTGWSRNTVLTYLTRMEAKGLVAIDKADTPHCYRAGVDREACAAQERQGLLDRVYRGSVGLMMSAMAQRQELTAEDLRQLRAILAQADEGKGGEEDA